MKRRIFPVFFFLILLGPAGYLRAEILAGKSASFDSLYASFNRLSDPSSAMYVDSGRGLVPPACYGDYSPPPPGDLPEDALPEPLYCNPYRSNQEYVDSEPPTEEPFTPTPFIYPLQEADYYNDGTDTAIKGLTLGELLRPGLGRCENFPQIGLNTAGRADGEPLYDIPVEINKRVKRFIRYYQTKGRRSFGRWLERSSRYLPMIKRIFREEGLPEDLAYLALIESGFNPMARSRANAVGLWQFMRGTARNYGLRSDWWMDERRDPEKSTRAAARYLKDLYGMFGSWYLAVAGYNAGEGRIKRAVRRHRSIDFWVLAKHGRTLKKETRNYVPKFMAALLIAKEPEKYGFHGLHYSPPLEYDKVRIPQAMDIKIIARAAGTTVSEIKRLNPELLRWFTPPNYPGYEIKIPKGKRELFAKNMKLIPPPERLRFHRHRVKRGETLWSIARKYGTGIRPIKYLNNIKSARLIREGSILVVPVRAKKHIKRTSYTYAKTPVSGTYTVKKGDTLWDISTRFNISLKLLMKWNGIGYNDILMPGQKLILSETAL